MTTNDNEWYNKWQWVAQRIKANESDFSFQNETIMHCITTIYSETSFWKYNVKQNICRNSHRRCSIKKAIIKNFTIFPGKLLKACNLIKKRLQHKCFPVIIAKFLKAPIFQNIRERLVLHLFFKKNKRYLRGSKNFHKKYLKNWWIGQVLS